MFNRREFLRSTAAGVSFVSLAGGVPGLLARAAAASAKADRNDHVLVVVELAGGNDGLNTLVPFENSLYYKNRPTLCRLAGRMARHAGQAGARSGVSTSRSHPATGVTRTDANCPW